MYSYIYKNGCAVCALSSWKLGCGANIRRRRQCYRCGGHIRSKTCGVTIRCKCNATLYTLPAIERTIFIYGLISFCGLLALRFILLQRGVSNDNIERAKQSGICICCVLGIFFKIILKLNCFIRLGDTYDDIFCRKIIRGPREMP